MRTYEKDLIVKKMELLRIGAFEKLKEELKQITAACAGAGLLNSGHRIKRSLQVYSSASADLSGELIDLIKEQKQKEQLVEPCENAWNEFLRDADALLPTGLGAAADRVLRSTTGHTREVHEVNVSLAIPMATKADYTAVKNYINQIPGGKEKYTQKEILVLAKKHFHPQTVARDYVYDLIGPRTRGRRPKSDNST